MDVGLVCDQCSAFNAMGVSTCVRCGSSVSLDGSEFDGKTSVGPGPLRQPAPVTRPPHFAASPEVVPCPVCGADVIAGHKFCGECGTRMTDAQGVPRHAPPAGSGPARTGVSGDKSGRRTLYFGAIQAARAKLTVIRGDGLDGVSYNLAGEDHQAGREDCPLLFPDDPFLSPLHCNFFYRDGQLIVKDEKSVNGVYVRIAGSKQIPIGARFLVGEQLMQVERGDTATADEAIADGTYFFASPRRPAHVRVVQILRGGDTGLAFRATSDVVTIGREHNDLDFPDDPFISGHHARVTWDGQQLILTDLNSKNGTFLKVVGEQALAHGDYVFMGQQLLRVEVV
jgi:pSer/pThr/pTyr-binding forkhead associated (FHA) protein